MNSIGIVKATRINAVAIAMTTQPAFGQVYLFGVAAAWRQGAVEHAREWDATLREHEAFSTLAAVRVALVPSYDPAAMGQFDDLIELLRAAGLPAG